jgi:hypothetical protein
MIESQCAGGNTTGGQRRLPRAVRCDCHDQ